MNLAEQVAQLSSLVPKLPMKDKEFAGDLIGKFHKKGTLSDKQLYWVEILIERATQPKPEPVKFEVGAFQNVIALFHKAQEKLKWPKIVLQCADKPIVLSMAGKAAKNPGWINVAGEGKWPDRPWYGKVSPEG